MTAEETPQKNLVYDLSESNMPFDRVEAVYFGRREGCRCGCLGNYRYTAANRERGAKSRGYAIDDDEVSDRSVRMAIKKILTHQAEGVEKLDLTGGGTFYGVTINGRPVSVYLFPKEE